MEWIQVAQKEVQWRFRVNMALNFGTIQEESYYLSRTLLCRFIHMQELKKTLVFARVLKTNSPEMLQLLAIYYDLLISINLYSLW
jgi:hypothetical protein